MGKKSSKARRPDTKPEPVASGREAIPPAPSAVSVEASASVQQLSAEVLAAHDSFVRSPAAVVESLGIRMTPAVARRFSSVPPPPPAVTDELDA